MKSITCLAVLSVALLSIAAPATAASSHPVRGYHKKNGTYVQPHRQTDPNNTKRDNWSSQGNTNPDTGKQGTVDPDAPSPTKQRKQ